MASLVASSVLYDSTSGTETVGATALSVLSGDLLVGLFRAQTTDLSSLDIDENDDTDSFILSANATVGTHAMRVGYLLPTADDSSFTPRAVIGTASTYRCIAILQFRPASGKVFALDVAGTAATGSAVDVISPTISTTDAGIVINALGFHSSSYSPTAWTIGGQAVDGNVSSGNARARIGYEIFASAQTDIYGNATIAGTVNWISTIIAFKETGAAPTEFSITYHGNGETSGAAPTDSGVYTTGETATILGPNTLAKTGHLFGGWSTRDDNLGTFYRETSLCAHGQVTFASDDIHLYAIWIDTTETVATGTSHYLSPTGSWTTGDGSSGNPFGPLSGLQASNKLSTREWGSGPLSTYVARNASGPIKAGDTIRLMAGYHGDVSINRAYNASPVVVIGETGSQLGSLEFEGASNWKFKNIAIGEAYRSGATPIGNTIDITAHVTYGPCARFTFDDVAVLGISDDPTTLTDTQWNTGTSTAGNINADTVVIRNVTATTVKSGLMCYGDNVHLSNTLVDGFCNDAYRMNGNCAVWTDWHARDCYKTDAEYHDDFFQSFVDAETPNLEWCGNSFNRFSFVNWYRAGNTYKGSCQGFGMYDGWYNDWYIANGLIATSHTNNFAILGCKNVRVENIGSIDQLADAMDDVCVRIRDHKDGDPSDTVLVRNCYGTALPAIDATTIDGSYDHCAVVELVDYASNFTAPSTFDFTLLAGATTLVNQGSSDVLSTLDLAKHTRSSGSSVDIGPYELITTPSGPCRRCAGNVFLTLWRRR